MSGDGSGARPGTLALVRRMARREAGVLLRHPPFGAWVADPPPLVRLRLTACPWCEDDGRQRTRPVPMGGVRFAKDGDREDPRVATLTALSCERLTPRPLLLFARATEQDGTSVPRQVMTRAAALAHLLTPETNGRWELVLPALDERERWVDEAGSASPAGVDPAPPVLPASFRPHLITPGLGDDRARRLHREYVRQRLSAVGTGLGMR